MKGYRVLGLLTGAVVMLAWSSAVQAASAPGRDRGITRVQVRKQAILGGMAAASDISSENSQEAAALRHLRTRKLTIMSAAGSEEVSLVRPPVGVRVKKLYAIGGAVNVPPPVTPNAQPAPAGGEGSRNRGTDNEGGRDR